jgi:AcrR family transcriptional regulator
MVSAVQGAIPGARLSAAQRREQFLDVAAQLVVEQGADAVTMEAVAARAGVSKALSYRYFDNAGALLVALFEREVIDLDRKIMAGVEHADSFEAKVRASFVGWGGPISDRGRLLGRLWQVSISSGPLLQARRERDRTINKFWGREVQAAYNLPTAIAETAAAILVQGTNGLLLSVFAGRGEQAELIQVYVTMTLGALDALSRSYAVGD